MPSWINSKKKTFLVEPQTLCNPVDLDKLNDMQSLAYNLVRQHFDNPALHSPLHLIINGYAGTGKGFLINVLRILLQRTCTVSATTGKASFNINGVTINSLLNLPVGPRGNKDLQGEALLRLQDKLRDNKYILIDEYSMLGQTTLGWIDKASHW